MVARFCSYAAASFNESARASSMSQILKILKKNTYTLEIGHVWTCFSGYSEWEIWNGTSSCIYVYILQYFWYFVGYPKRNLGGWQVGPGGLRPGNAWIEAVFFCRSNSGSCIEHATSSDKMVRVNEMRMIPCYSIYYMIYEGSENVMLI